MVAVAREVVESRKVLDRCRIEGGSFFESIPGGADCYVLKYVIHDWDDARAKSILTNCRKVMRPSSKLLVADYVLPDRPEEGRSVAGFIMDIEMLLRACNAQLSCSPRPRKLLLLHRRALGWRAAF